MGASIGATRSLSEARSIELMRRRERANRRQSTQLSDVARNLRASSTEMNYGEQTEERHQ
jgi:hypothetical protein